MRCLRIPLLFIACEVSLVMVGAAGQTRAAEDAAWQWKLEAGKSAALVGPKGVVWQFNYDAKQPKPYFHPVALPDGRVLTWNSPPDHVWHHGLWFSWKYINGVNYWEPINAKTGPYAGRTQWSDVKIDARDDQTAKITMKLAYRDPKNVEVLSEARRMEFSAPDASGGYSIDWTATFTAGKQEVKLDRTPLESEKGGQPWGGYAGLSVRFARELVDREANSTAGPATFVSDRARPTAVAADYNGQLSGGALGVAMLAHPQNPRHPTPWYLIRAQPMSYMNAALLTYEPLVIAAGESITLRYRVIVHTQRWGAERLKAEQQRYLSTP